MTNPLTFRQLDSLSLSTIGANENSLDPGERQATINQIFFKLYADIEKTGDSFYTTIANLILNANGHQTDLTGIQFNSNGILSVYDDVVRQNQNEFDRILTPDGFRDFTRTPYRVVNDKRIGFFVEGQTMKFAIGANALPVGNLTLKYRFIPESYSDTTADHNIQMPVQYNKPLQDEIEKAFALMLGQSKETPQKTGKDKS